MLTKGANSDHMLTEGSNSGHVLTKGVHSNEGGFRDKGPTSGQMDEGIRREREIGKGLI